jgi:nicotinamide riboside transporter PnuC
VNGSRGRPLPQHPYRDSAVLYAILAIIIVVASLLTGGGLRGLLVAIAFFIAATGWSWWRFHARLERHRGRR